MQSQKITMDVDQAIPSEAGKWMLGPPPKRQRGRQLAKLSERLNLNDNSQQESRKGSKKDKEGKV